MVLIYFFISLPEKCKLDLFYLEKQVEGISYGLCGMGNPAALCSCTPMTGSQAHPQVAQKQMKPGL